MSEQPPYKELLSILEALIEAWWQDPDNKVITIVVPDWPMAMASWYRRYLRRKLLKKPIFRS